MAGCCFSTPSTEEPLEGNEPQQQSQAPPSSDLKKDGNFRVDGDWPFTEFFLSDIQTATKNFSPDVIVSENRDESSNVVYKGQFQNLGFVAVKKLDNTTWPDPGIFAWDAQTVGEKLRHKRVVNLIGYCCDGDERILVSEFMPNDSLAKRLFHQKSQTMDWAMRLRVAYCIAEALDYCNTKGLESYDNLSAYTILFDENGDAYLSSFGFVRETYSVRRTPGCVKYRFGIVLVNLISGKEIPLSHAPEMINVKDVTELMDPNLHGKFSAEEATAVLELASRCLQYEDRLSTKDFVATLEALQTKTEVSSFEMPEMAKQLEEASSSSQEKQQLEALQTRTEVSRGLVVKQQEEASSPNQGAQLEPLQTTSEAPSAEMKDETSSLQLSPLGEACSRMDLNAIHEILVKAQYEDDKKVLECSFQEWLPGMSGFETVGKLADDAFEEKDFEFAFYCYSKIIEGKNVVSPSVYARRCLSYLFCDKPELAHIDMVQAQEKYPDWPTGYYLMSVVFTKASMTTESADMLKQATLLEAKRQSTMVRDEES